MSFQISILLTNCATIITSQIFVEISPKTCQIFGQPGPNAKCQIQYWASLSPIRMSLLIHHCDHVTFYTLQSKSKSGLRLGKSNPSLI